MKNFLYANLAFTGVISCVTLVNVLFAWEGNSPIPPYAWNIIRLTFIEGAFWILAGIIYLVWIAYTHRKNRRMGILRYDGRRGEWYYQR